MNTSSEILTQRSVETLSSLEASPSKKSKGPILVPWDRQKTYSFAFLAVCFIVWAGIFFPLMK
nr:unnamed protein product [Callosobruchus analis]